MVSIYSNIGSYYNSWANLTINLVEQFQILLLLFLMSLIPIQLQADHYMGGELSYRCLGNDKYEITLKAYRYCGGVGIATEQELQAVSMCNGSILPIELELIDSLEVTPLCSKLLPCTDCNIPIGSNCSHPYPGVEKYTYRGTIKFPSKCSKWDIGGYFSARNINITNLNMSGTWDNMYLDMRINNKSGICNSSPVFSELPVPYICNNQLHNYNHGVYDSEGDSIVYELIQPRESKGNLIPYANPYTIKYPMATSFFSFDTLTGQLTMIPNLQQQAVLSVRVKEYRNGKLIGYTMREMQFVVYNCDDNRTPSLSLTTNPGGGYKIDSVTLGVCPGNTLEFNIIGSDSNQSDSIFINSNFDSIIENATYSISGTVNPNIASFSWSPTLSDTGIQYFTVTARDNHCPYTATTSQVYAIEVVGKVRAGPDKIYCSVQDEIELSAYGGTSFHWSPTNSIVNAASDSSWIRVSPNQTTIYTVTSEDCKKSKDSIKVEVVPGFNSYSITNGDSICTPENMKLEVNADPKSGNYDVLWYPNNELDTNGGFEVVAQPKVSTTYTVDIISEDGCKVTDSINVTVGNTQLFSTFENKNYLCYNEEKLNLHLLRKPIACGIEEVKCNVRSNIASQIGIGSDSTSSVTPFFGNKVHLRMQILYTEKELKNLGLKGGFIEGIAFNVTQKITNSTFPDFNIKMGCTNLEELPLSFEEDLTTVYNSSFNSNNFSTNKGWTSIPLNGWNSIPLNEGYGFNWNGNSNLIVEICFAGNTNYGNDWVEYTETDFTSVAYKAANAGPGCDFYAPSDTSSLRPNLRLTFCSRFVPNTAFSWEPTTGVSDPTIPDPVISGLEETTEYIITANHNGCIGRDTTTIYVDTTSLTATPDTLLCDSSTLQLSANAIGSPPASGSFHYQWSQLTNGDSTLSSDTVSNPVALPHEGESLYQVAIETEYGCIIYDTVAVTKDILEAMASEDTAICAGEQVRLLADGGTAYQWNPPDGLTAPDSAYTQAAPANSTPYTVTIQSAAGCVEEKEVHVAVNDTPNADAGMAQSILAGEVATLNASGGATYHWQPPAGLSDTTTADPGAQPQATTTYTVAVTDANGCTSSDTVTVYVSECQNLFQLPNAFTPNGDGLNDRFAPLSLPGEQDFTGLRIYNRWGEVVYRTIDPAEGWDGTFRGKPQDPGVYTYVLEYRCGEEPQIKTGNVTLIR